MGQFHIIDVAILISYLIATVGIGFWIARKASKSLNNYFLGGNSIPWYMLGLSNASGMFDISGTMWMVYLLFVYGLKSAWIPWLWPAFNQIFMMVYLSIWLRRSGVMTGAEWIRFRFGDKRGAQCAHMIVVLFAIINVIGFLAYGFIGIGKFSAEFLPWQLAADPTVNANLYGLAITLLTTVYVVKGGMMSVVFTEVLQFFIMTIGCIWVGIIAMQTVSPEMLATVVPEGWGDLWFGWNLDLDWSGIMASANQKINDDGWDLFTIFFMMVLFKGCLQSMAGPAPNYDMQRVLSAKTPREAALMSGFVSLVLLVPRYMLITGLTVLALAFFSDELNGMGADVDFERILPMAMKQFIPVGLFGLLISALLAAFMSTYAATVNAAPAYIVNDIYKRYINPDASEKTCIRMSYATSIAVVVIGISLGFVIDSLNDIVQWIVASLYGGYISANLLKWHWWRFNGWGYFFGMASGIAGALFCAVMFSDINTLSVMGFVMEKNLALFPAIFIISMLGSILGSLFTPADDEEVLDNFYLKTRPWGLWGPVYQRLLAKDPNLLANEDLGRDLLNVAIGIVWQTSLTVTGIYLVLQDYYSLSISVGLILVTSTFLKFNWYDRLSNEPQQADTVA